MTNANVSTRVKNRQTGKMEFAELSHLMIGTYGMHHTVSNITVEMITVPEASPETT